jgi:hypothetical protein
MALFNTDTTVKCSCGNDTFTEVEVFRIVNKAVKQTLSSTTVSVKDIIGNKIQCTSCGKIMPNPLNK